MRKFFKWTGYVFLALIVAALYAAFEGVRSGVHVGLAIFVVGWIAKDLVQEWVREVVRSELEGYAHRNRADSERLKRIDSIISNIGR